MVKRSYLKRKRIPRKAFQQLHVEQLEVRHMLDGVTLAGDAYAVNQNGPQIELDVLANDIFESQYQGARLITSASYGSEGGRIELAADRQSILYTPPADFFGSETFVYSVDGELTAEVQVSVRAALAVDRFEIPPDGLERVLDVLANDPFWAGYLGQRKITAVSVGSAGGTVAIDDGGQSISYTPPDEAFGEETFIYIVDDVYPAQVTIEIPKTLDGDTYETIQHASPLTLDVLANDPFWPGYSGERRITHVVGAVPGSAEISADGRSIIYSPADDALGWQTFRYVVDGEYEATVNVQIHRPVQDDWFEVDQNSTAYHFEVTLNDTYRDLGNQWHDAIDRVTSVTQSEKGGTVTISSDGGGILYTPAVGFSGADTFAYTADGVHEATVHVQVTRPVRDDHISNSVIQDTPGGVLNVLANDFLGDGYGGPRLITAVGATEYGGTLTIRGDGKAILYTAAPGFTGQDTFTYTVDGALEATVTVFVRPLAESDSFKFAPDPTRGPYTLNVLGNDLFQNGYAGPGVITAVSLIAGDGSVSIQNGQRLLFDPDHAGSHTLRYVVDGKYETTASVWIVDHLDPDLFVVDQNSPVQELDVLANDFAPDPYYVEFKSQDYRGPRRITSASQSQRGGVVTVTADGLSVSYVPPADFHGADQFTYTVDGFMTATVTVEVIRRVRDDQYRVDAADGQQALPVLVNDLFGANYSGTGQITGLTARSAGGTATIAADGRSILYTPPVGFVGMETFTYTVDGALKAEVSVVVDAPRDEQSPTFGSLEEYTQFLINDALARYQNLFGQTAWYGYPYYTNYDSAGPTAAEDRSHSETNVQVAGVDEGDIVEFDANYIYTLTDNEVVIVNAWPAEDLSVASRVDIEGRPIAEFLHGDRLTVISEVGGGYDWPLIWAEDGLIGPVVDHLWWPPIPRLPSSTIVTVIDVSDRTSPAIVQTTTMEGKYVDSRGVAGFVYVLTNNADAIGSAPEIIDEDNDPATRGRYETREEYLARITANAGEFVDAALPNYSSYDSEGDLVRTGLLNTPEDIYRPLVPDVTTLISVMSFNVESNEPGLTDSSAVYSTGASAIYASLNNFYVFDKDRSQEDGAATRIMKFDWEPATGGVDFAATTTVPGSILNQFSADENGDYLRIATTVGNDSSGNWSSRDENMLFVLQEDDGVFEVVGSLQNLALNESIQSVRFMGDRAFISTFRAIDPLFAIDLSDPTRPESIGHITLPGFTSYMQLIDENHLLTVGRNTPVGHSGPTQVALFDISDLTEPRRIAEYTFERFSTSEAEIDHHAFGYYAEHGLLGMPVGRVYFERIDTDGDGYHETRQTRQANDLAVFKVNVSASEPEGRLRLVSEIAHGTPVRRSGYIGDKLYSIANDSVKVVDVAAPDVVIAEVIIDAEAEIGPPGTSFQIDHIATIGASTETEFPAAQTDAPHVAAIDRAARDLASRLGREAGAPLLITAETAPTAPGGGYFLVFRVGDIHYLYRASESGLVELVESDFEFGPAKAGAWHAVDMAIASYPSGIAGDFNRDGSVDGQDRQVWKESFGALSLTATLPADGNRDGIVDAADYTLWRDNFGVVVGDYNRDGTVDDGDHAFWKLNFGATSGPGLAADGNGNGIVDAGDYSVWRDKLAVPAPSGALAALLTSEEVIVPARSADVASAETTNDESHDIGQTSFEAALSSVFPIPANASHPIRATTYSSDGARTIAQTSEQESLIDLQMALQFGLDTRNESIRSITLAAVDEAIETFDAGDNAPVDEFSAFDEEVLAAWAY